MSLLKLLQQLKAQTSGKNHEQPVNALDEHKFVCPGNTPDFDESLFSE